MTPNLRQLFPMVAVDFTAGIVHLWLRYDRTTRMYVEYASHTDSSIVMEQFLYDATHRVVIRRFGSAALQKDLDSLTRTLEKRPLIFGVDYDKTFNADPEMFQDLVKLLRRHGHTVVLVTQRCVQFEAEMRAVIQIADLPIVFAAGHTKQAKAKSEGYPVDIWVEDNPFSIHTALSYRGCNE